MDIKTRVSEYLLENSISDILHNNMNLLRQCFDQCSKRIINNKDYSKKMAVCISACKIKEYSKIIAKLEMWEKTKKFKNYEINQKLKYFKQQLNKERYKYTTYRQKLKKDQTTIPVNLSTKPSPERWNSSKFN